MKKIEEIISHYPPGFQKSATIPLLDLAQRQHGWVPLAAMNKVARILDVPRMMVYEVASFYTMFKRDPIGKHLVSLCGTTPCQLCGFDDIKAAVENHLGIKCGQTTSDGLFTLEEVECLGACVNAPMMQIWDHYYEDLTPETAIAVLETLREGKQPKVGPQRPDRQNCEPVGGLTTLLEPPKGPYAPYLDQPADPAAKIVQ